MGEDDDRTRPITPLRQPGPGDQQPPIKMVPEGLTMPRLYGWALAFTIVGVSVCVMLMVLVVVAVVFADRLPQ